MRWRWEYFFSSAWSCFSSALSDDQTPLSASKRLNYFILNLNHLKISTMTHRQWETAVINGLIGECFFVQNMLVPGVHVVPGWGCVYPGWVVVTLVCTVVVSVCPAWTITVFPVHNLYRNSNNMLSQHVRQWCNSYHFHGKNQKNIYFNLLHRK